MSAEGKADPAIIDPVMYKFRSLFPDKSVKAITGIFVEMTNSVYGKTGAGGKGKKDAAGGKGKDKESAGALERWGNLAASMRSMNLIEFKIAMYRFKSAGITFEEIRRVFICLDTSGNGRVELDEFLLGIRGEISPYRLRLVIFLFRKLDEDTSGFIEEEELINYLKSRNIPPLQKAEEFIEQVGTPGKGDKPGTISPAQLVDYYHSKGLEKNMSDEEFKQMLFEEWALDEDSRGHAESILAHTEASNASRFQTPARPKPASPERANAPSVTQASPRMRALQNSRDAPRDPPRDVNRGSELARNATSEKLHSSQHGQQQNSRPVTPTRVSGGFAPGMVSTPKSNVDQHQVQLQQHMVQQNQIQQLNMSLPPQVRIPAAAAAMESNIVANLNALVTSLQQKILEQNKIIESQQQIIQSQQQMLGQLQNIIAMQSKL